jgi:hypothetical protein
MLTRLWARFDSTIRSTDAASVRACGRVVPDRGRRANSGAWAADHGRVRRGNRGFPWIVAAVSGSLQG